MSAALPSPPIVCKILDKDHFETFEPIRRQAWETEFVRAFLPSQLVKVITTIFADRVDQAVIVNLDVDKLAQYGFKLDMGLWFDKKEQYPKLLASGSDLTIPWDCVLGFTHSCDIKGIEKLGVCKDKGKKKKKQPKDEERRRKCTIM